MEDTDMYKTTFIFRDGNDVTLWFDDYYEAYEFLLQHATEFYGESLYAAVSYHGNECDYTIDLADWRFGYYGEVISLGGLVSIISEDYPSELMYGRVEEINAVDGMIRITVFDTNINDIWVSIEKFA